MFEVLKIVMHAGLDCFFQDETVSMEQSPGCLYIGNLVTVEHEVKHHDAEDAVPLYQPEGRLKKDLTGEFRKY